MFELATDFSKLTKVPKYLCIDQNWDYDESQKNAVKFIKSLICRNIEVPNDVPNENEYVGLGWRIDCKTINRILDIITNIDVRCWRKLTYTSLRNTGVRTWKNALTGQYVIKLLKKHNISDDKILFSDLTIMITGDYTNISFVVTNQITNECKIKGFYSFNEFIKYFNNIKNL